MGTRSATGSENIGVFASLTQTAKLQESPVIPLFNTLLTGTPRQVQAALFPNSDKIDTSETVTSPAKWLNRRSQRRSFTWARFNAMFKRYKIPTPTIKEAPSKRRYVKELSRVNAEVVNV